MVGAYWEPSSELEWELVSGILGGGIGNLMNVELGKYYQKTLLRTIGNLIRKPIINPVGNPRSGTLSQTQNSQPSWPGSLLWTTFGTEREFFQNLLLGTVSGTLSAIREPYRQAYREPVNNLSSKAPYPNFVGNLKHGTLHFDPIGNPVGNLETPIRNLVGNLKPETRNRELVGNLVGNREASSRKLPRHAPKHLLTAEDPKLWAVGEKMCWELCWKISWGFCWEPCLGTLLKLLRTLLGTL